ncbi:16S rRNA (cytosine(1402)-N(4))-methyltransferase RsmH [Planktotalea sp.]|uniref:16S rRNA (cytosine(1402)-N(4))-methyltransferase RsmH n=1 Tax=Planktotalea sp. TaxID=2029877 RepID=UPI0025FE8B7C|nr:16S rRNA (cytosine(1402)-N(4))-methyltransferase RsmH [Planktotalea sp.]
MEQAQTSAPHIPVLLAPILKAAAPIAGRWMDGTFGAGGYTRALLDAGADSVIAVDRDPMAFDMAASWAGEYGDRLIQQRGVFSDMAEFAQDLDGVVLDLGVSSMQLDIAERGFSFMRDGPLDMRMGQDGQSAADIVNEYESEEIAEILYNFGEERASRRIARAIIEQREETPFTTTLQLADLIEKCLPRKKPGQSHPATRSFQALRIAVNDEYGELYRGLMAAEQALAPGGILAVVTFHSVEDRMAKRFLQSRAGTTGNANRFAPELITEKPAFELVGRKAITASEEELDANPRARSAKLRLARRTDAPSGEIAAKALGMPMLRRDR